MIVSTYRPYFAPFSGFFEKIMRSDIMVILDSVQFPLGRSWLTRNRFKNDKGTYWIRIPVWKTGKGIQKINEVKICYERGWTEKALKGLGVAYKNAPYFLEYMDFWKQILKQEIERLVDINLTIIRYVMDYFYMDTKLILLSELGIEEKEPMLTLRICKRLKASQFLAQKSAKKYLDINLLQREGIEPLFFTPVVPVYPQLWGEFIPNLSIFDIMFNCGPKAIDIIKRDMK